ncbi:MAG: ATP-binding protein [Candidatus Buchananbacteria bacterium]
MKMTQNNFNLQERLVDNSVFTIGSVFSVKGRDIVVKVNKDKNLPHLFFKGRTIKNVSVGLSNYVKIIKGFTEIICKVEGEYLEEDRYQTSKKYTNEKEKIDRFLNVSVFGFYDHDCRFQHGIKEMPLIGSECRLLSRKEFEILHQLSSKNELSIILGSLIDEETQEIGISVKGLFAGHIGIFGNTGSGKSNTLAKMYTELFNLKNLNSDFKKKSKFVVIDFNGEYSGDKILSDNKRVYKLSTELELEKINKKNRIPINEDSFIDIELLSILSNATEKTQKPFLNRTINLYKKITKVPDDLNYFKNNLKLIAIRILKLKNKELAYLCVDRYKQILKIQDDDAEFSLPEWHNTHSYFKCGGDSDYDNITDEQYKSQSVYTKPDEYTFPDNVIEKFLDFSRMQLLYDLLDNRAQNDHIYPAITKLESIKKSIQKVFDTNVSNRGNIFGRSNVVIIDLKSTNRDIKKSLPLVILKRLYEKQKSTYKNKSSFHIIIDEAHNILSENSVRESETWKDYRLETFEEIIKEGRKFGVFLTIASQRPSDISPTIISQLHNYFIHRLMNENDLRSINKAVSYLDKLSFDSISNLSVGCCFIAGQMTQFPLSVKVKLLDKDIRPQSGTIDLDELWKDKNNI